jgi:hypothetical protein
MCCKLCVCHIQIDGYTALPKAFSKADMISMTMSENNGFNVRYPSAGSSQPRLKISSMPIKPTVDESDGTALGNRVEVDALGAQQMDTGQDFVTGSRSREGVAPDQHDAPAAVMFDADR